MNAPCCPSPSWIKWGKTSGGAQRVRCKHCKTTGVIDKTPRLAALEKKRALVHRLRDSESVRELSRRADIAKQTVLNWSGARPEDDAPASGGICTICDTEDATDGQFCGDEYYVVCSRCRLWYQAVVHESECAICGLYCLGSSRYCKSCYLESVHVYTPNFCLECKVEISASATRCRNCHNRPTRDLDWPFGWEHPLIEEIDNALPDGLPNHVREDVAQELAVHLLSKNEGRAVDDAKLRKLMRRLLRRHYRTYQDFKMVSLDAPTSGHDDRSLLDKISSFSQLYNVLSIDQPIERAFPESWLTDRCTDYDPEVMAARREQERMFVNSHGGDTDATEGLNRDGWGGERWELRDGPTFTGIRKHSSGVYRVVQRNHEPGGRFVAVVDATLSEAQSIAQHSLGEETP